VVRVLACQVKCRGFNPLHSRKITIHMTFLFSEYSLLLVYVIVSLFLAIFIFFASFLLATQSPYPEKVSPYECGFAPFDDARNEFDVRFYLVAILFLVFDLEASFLFPWSICLSKISFGAYWVMFDFFLELFVGFFYVWFVGGLDWELFYGWKAFWLCVKLQI
jgi:NADH:ubiquinone oxidoreductase subunit 3 (subunit A)